MHHHPEQADRVIAAALDEGADCDCECPVPGPIVGSDSADPYCDTCCGDLPLRPTVWGQVAAAAGEGGGTQRGR